MEIGTLFIKKKNLVFTNYLMERYTHIQMMILSIAMTKKRRVMELHLYKPGIAKLKII
jgi:hypothetical protein